MLIRWKRKSSILDYGTFPSEVKLKKLDIPYDPVCYIRTNKDEIIDRIKDAEIIITNKVKITSDILDEAKKLEFIAVAATGTDVIDLEACKIKKSPFQTLRIMQLILCQSIHLH